MRLDLSAGIHLLPRSGEQGMTTIGDAQIAVNPYAAFGNPTIWPRGFPLDALWNGYYNYVRRFVTRPYIQQGIVLSCCNIQQQSLRAQAQVS